MHLEKEWQYKATISPNNINQSGFVIDNRGVS